MREIKFRGWDKIDKKMYQRVGISLYGVQAYADNDNFPEQLIIDRGQNCFEIMQFTGLLDKNGKEIYEGDIVGIPYVNPMGTPDKEWSYEAKVIFKNGCFWLEYCQERPVPQFILDWVKREEGEYIPNYGNPVIYKDELLAEVIGNIHENKDLLEKE